MALTQDDLQSIGQLMQVNLEPIKAEIKSVQDDVRDIKLTLENETNRNIQLVAEGHSFINRRLDEVLKVESEKEMLLIRVNRLENELRRIKEKLEIA